MGNVRILEPQDLGLIKQLKLEVLNSDLLAPALINVRKSRDYLWQTVC